MQIKDNWEIDDAVSGLKLKAIPGKVLNHLHIESTNPDARPMNRDFWFTKDGDFDGTGSDIKEKGD